MAWYWNRTRQEEHTFHIAGVDNQPFQFLVTESLLSLVQCFVLHIWHHVSFPMVCIAVQPEQGTPAYTNYYDNHGYEIQPEKAVLFK